ncbi:CobW family GTP-binding protein [Agrobacterium rubi]|uniref:GTP-binding protein n=1 Tax=Agrobacterium rubi TaxID=28099 RepID=A0AAE7UR33_9HYPH|nr:GTP-binding protein [Agrobacterium rubi]NTE89532.1 GTP-binding protein [Agrobacterium rubi]NTF05668.1 GTP-binding protein [Agrobacterium rubi]NTF10805.1 GTP-binding protein [Agrobacterium rubi]NTF23221.1 GTP-binding protein [Agrobacterium rubi]NTF30141.1 GTP-binding protein [Agrobacterium rubi]
MIGGLFKRRKDVRKTLEEPEVRRLYDSIPVTVLTGFLGSGKTTLLNEILADPSMASTAVIINEFGSVPIDHNLVRTGSERYFKTTTGCICCTATSDIRVSLFDLHEALLRGEVPLVSRVIIETTGLADPAPIINSIIPGGAPAMGLRDHVVARHFHLAGVVTAFDVLNGRATLDSFLEGWKQLAFADHVILTKTDLAEGGHDWPSELRMLNPSAHYHDRQGQDFEMSMLFRQGHYAISGKADDVEGWLAMEALRQHPDHTHDPNRHGAEVEAISLTHEVNLSPQAVETFLHILSTNVSSGLLRMKGIFALTDDPERPLVAHAVQHRLHPLQRLERWPSDDRSSRVVLIGRDMPIKQIRDLFEVLAPRSTRKHRRAK